MSTALLAVVLLLIAVGVDSFLSRITSIRSSIRTSISTYLSISPTSTVEADSSTSNAAAMEQFIDEYSEKKNHYLVELTQPTGLFIAYTPNILTPKILQECNSKDISMEKYLNDFICVLHHNCVDVNIQYDQVFEALNVLTKSQCDGIIHKSEEYASNNGDDIFGRFSSIQSTIEGIMLEMLANKYSLDEEYLKVEEMFVAKYEFAENKQSSLAAHQDGTPFSFVLTLNNPGIDFDGGGTRFVDEDQGRGVVYSPTSAGSGIGFCGKKLHEGVSLTRGTRYILTGFCSYNIERPTHASYMSTYDKRWDGSAAECGIRTGDLLKAVFVYSESGYEMLFTTADMPVESLYQAIARSAKTKGAKIRVIVERRCVEEEEENNALADEERLPRHWLADYVKQHATRLFSTGYCWGFDHLLGGDKKNS